MGKFEVKMAVEVYSPKDWKFRVESTNKLKMKTTIEVFSPKHWRFRVKNTIKFKVNMTEQKLKKKFVVIIFNDFFFKKDILKLKIQKRVNVEEGGLKEGCECQGREDEFLLSSHQIVITFQGEFCGGFSTKVNSKKSASTCLGLT